MYFFQICELIKIEFQIKHIFKSQIRIFIYKMNFSIFLVYLIPRYFLELLLTPKLKDNTSKILYDFDPPSKRCQCPIRNKSFVFSSMNYLRS